MFVGLGTVINLLTIIVGAAIGIALGGRLPKKSQKMITDVLGLITLLGATSALLPLWSNEFKDSSDSPFVEGFVSASLLFVIGPLAILGSVSDGMSQGLDQLILKSSLDFFAAMAFASTLGIGVMASIIPVGIYQGFWTIIGFFAGSVLEQYQIDAMTISGGLMLVGIGLRLLNIKKISVANLLPALVIAPVLATVLHSI